MKAPKNNNNIASNPVHNDLMYFSFFEKNVHYLLAENYTPVVKTSNEHIKKNKAGKKDTILITNIYKKMLLNPIQNFIKSRMLYQLLQKI
ncbi:hypothetical protein [Viridibacillus arvi]|uniref:hypothetical protein n=1 Tax=Viridibacillus arvi TaxID=263475 RepID=UPI0036E5A911